MEFNDIEIGDAYNQTKTLTKITKGDIKFFSDIDSILKEVDRIIKQVFIEVYSADEL